MLVALGFLAIAAIVSNVAPELGEDILLLLMQILAVPAGITFLGSIIWIGWFFLSNPDPRTVVPMWFFICTLTSVVVGICFFLFLVLRRQTNKYKTPE